MNHTRNNRGTSIVEVLVVMVILFVGILTIVGLFPPGFLSVRYAENMTLAGRLAQFEVEHWKNNPNNIPEGVVAIDSAGNVQDNCFAGTPIKDNNALAFRRIIGETTRIPFGGWDANGPMDASIYVLTYAPIATGDYHVLAVKGGNLSRRVIDSSDDAWNDIRAYQYAIDYDAGGGKPKVCFPKANNARTYYLNCSWWEDHGSGAVYRTATNIRFDVPAGTTAWYDVTFPGQRGTYLDFDNNSDTVARGFVDVGPFDFSNDPYEYRLVDPILGIIGFNPIGYSQTEFGQALKARIDYDILDPQIIREERRITAHPPSMAVDAPYTVNMTLKRIMKKDESWVRDIDAHEDTIYTGLPGIYLDDPTAALHYDVIIIDTATGYLIDPRRVVRPGNPPAGPDVLQVEVNHKDGVVRINTDSDGKVQLVPTLELGGAPFLVSPVGRHFKFLYKAEGDWSVQLQKSYAAYERSYNNAVDYKSYHINGSEPARLWFAPCNGTHSVSVDYEYDAGGGELRKVVGECHRISDELIGGRVYTDLNNTPTRVFAVNGVSIRARVVWRDGENWRHVDLETTLSKLRSE